MKRQRHEADHLPPFTAKVKNEWSYTSTPPHDFMTCTRISLYYALSYKQTREALQVGRPAIDFQANVTKHYTEHYTKH
jgi:hypothetical protein